MRPPIEDLSHECLVAEEAIVKATTGIVSDLVELHGALSKEEVEKLSKALRDFVVQCPEHVSNGSAIWALTKLDDRTLVPFFLNQMRIHFLARRFHPVSQAEYGLLRLEHPIAGYEFSPGETAGEGYWKAIEEFLGMYR